jgi:hypothetical protein
VLVAVTGTLPGKILSCPHTVVGSPSTLVVALSLTPAVGASDIGDTGVSSGVGALMVALELLLEKAGGRRDVSDSRVLLEWGLDDFPSLSLSN